MTDRDSKSSTEVVRPRVLIVDDRPENLTALEAVLEPLQLETVRATSGEQALRRILDSDFAVVLLDVQMPGMDGFEVARHIKSREKSRSMPVIFLSAIDANADRIMTGYSAGAVDFLPKPFDPTVLRAKVSAFVELDRKTKELERRGRELADAAQRELQLRRRAERAEQEARAAHAAAELERHAADAANRAKSAFLSSMSHELRTPLNSVIGFANILLKNKAQSLRPHDLALVERIRSNGLHLLGLINDVLDLSKIEAGKTRVDAAPLPLEELVEETLLELNVNVKAGVNLRTEIELPLYPLYTDRTKLKQILINLVGNAVKFTEAGAVTIRVNVEQETRIPVSLEVQDTGIGIAEERLGRIFEAFEQADEGTSRRYGGTGLGLAISARLAQLLGYRIEVESRLGHGSVFRINFGS